MKVKDLIEKLQKFDPEMRVACYCAEAYCEDGSVADPACVEDTLYPGGDEGAESGEDGEKVRMIDASVRG